MLAKRTNEKRNHLLEPYRKGISQDILIYKLLYHQVHTYFPSPNTLFKNKNRSTRPIPPIRKRQKKGTSHCTASIYSAPPPMLYLACRRRLRSRYGVYSQEELYSSVSAGRKPTPMTRAREGAEIRCLLLLVVVVYTHPRKGTFETSFNERAVGGP